MSINYCTIDGSTINAFCNNQRARVLARLIPELHPAAPVQPGGSHGTVAPGWANFRQQERWVPPVISTERDRIVVRANFQNLHGQDEQEVQNRLDIVFVTNLNIEPTSISVNISNLKVN